MELGKVSLPQFSSNAQVYAVNGFYVRNNVFQDYTQGGNWQKYKWIPEKEIWLDYANEIEWPFICLHELHEAYLMGQGMEYNPAHDAANVLERQARENPEGVLDMIFVEQGHI